MVIEDLVAEGTVESGMGAIRYIVSGIGKGTWRGIPADGKQVTFAGMQITQAKDGLTVDVWEINDTMSVLMQLGTFPVPGGVAHT